MSQAEIVDRAVQAIGNGQPDDWIIEPARHAEELKERAPVLAMVLRTSRVQAPMQQYVRINAEAIEAQRTYKRVITQANIAILMTAILSAALLATGLIAGKGEAGIALALLGLLSLLTGALAAAWLTRVRAGRLLENWMRSRAMAEQARLAYFEAVVDSPVTNGSEIPLPLLKFEYFRRYQFDVQMAFFNGRRHQHRKSAGTTVMLASLAAIPASFAAGAGGLIGGLADFRWLPLAAIGSIGAALTFFASMRENITGDTATAERYAAVLSKLEALSGRLDDVRAAALAGDPPTIVQDFVKLVHDELSREQEAWLKNGETARAGLTEQLDQALKRKPDQNAPAPQKVTAPVTGPQ